MQKNAIFAKQKCNKPASLCNVLVEFLVRARYFFLNYPIFCSLYQALMRHFKFCSGHWSRLYTFLCCKTTLNPCNFTFCSGQAKRWQLLPLMQIAKLLFHFVFEIQLLLKKFFYTMSKKLVHLLTKNIHGCHIFTHLDLRLLDF